MSPSIISYRISLAVLLAGILCFAAGAVSLYRIPLVEDLLLMVAARDRLQQDFNRLDLQGKMSPDEFADFQAYLGTLGLRIARQCQEVVQRYPEIEVQELPCPTGGQKGSPAIDLGAEKTPEEQIAAMDATLASGLSEFDEMLLKEQQSIDAKARRSGTAGQGGSEGGAGDDRRDKGQSGDYDSRAAADAAEVEWDKVEDAGEYGGREPPGAAAGGAREQGPGTPRSDIPDGRDDDVVARQLREAAEKEKDPRLKEKLWDEYRRYKASAR